MRKSILNVFFLIALSCPYAAISQTLSEDLGPPEKATSQDAKERPNAAIELKDNVEALVDKASGAVVAILSQSSPGSGVIVSQTDNNYIVLTSAHVVRGLLEGDALLIRTSDGHEHRSTQIDVSPWLDLASVRFKSSTRYPVLPVAAPNTDGGISVVLGYPIGSSKLAFVPSLNFTGLSLDLTGRDGGYVFGYSTRVPALPEWGWLHNTLRGMSGGPVVSQSGEVIAIHGEADRYASQNPRENMVGSASGLSLGIPLRDWELLQNSLATYTKQDYIRDQPRRIDNVQDLSLKASRLSSEGRYTEAIGIWTEMIRRDPTEGSYFANRALARSETGDEKGALLDYDKAVELFPDSWQIYALRGSTKSSLRDHDGAQSDFIKSLQINSVYYRAVMLRMRDFLRAGKSSDAISTAKAYLNNLDLRSDGAFLIGSELIRAYFSDDQSEAALEFGKKLASAHPNEPMLSILLSQVYRGAGRDQDALSQLRRDLPKFSSNSQFLYQLAITELDLGNPRSSASHFSRLLTISPDDHALHAYKCYALVKSTRPEEAIKSCRQSIRLMPKFHLAHRYLGLALHQTRSLKEAEQSYSNALHFSKPQSAIDYLNRGEVRWELGKRDLSCIDFRTSQREGLSEKQSVAETKASWSNQFVDYCSK